MPDQVTLEQLEAMSIWQLRDYARKLGHSSPTMLRKAELVQFIFEKNNKMVKGEELAPQVAESAPKKRGRPPKKIITEYANVPEQTVEEKAPANVTKPENETSWQNFAPRGNFAEGKKPAWHTRTFDVKKPDKTERSIPIADRALIHEMGECLSRQQRISEDSRPADCKPTATLPVTEAADQSTNILEETAVREGVLEICPDGYGFLRANNYEQGEGDAYVSVVKIRRSGLRKGDYVVANVKKLAENRPWNVQDIISVNGMKPDSAFNRVQFDSLTPIFPDVRYKLELPLEKNDFAIRAIDLVAPIGKGQRAMIVSPPKAGKTTLLKQIAHSITKNNPNAHMIVLLVDERPEEVTDMKRSIDGEVVYSTFDELPEHHTKVAEMVLERAKRLVEIGKDVVILLDSITRLARAYNLTITPTGKILSGGIDPGALYSPKRFFGAARNIENGGSLTIIATALVDTGSRMDDVIYEEFKGTGNMEIHLDRKLSEKRIFPAIDLNRSGTRKEELLLDKKELEGIWAVRKMLSAGDVQEATEKLIAMMMKTTTNKEFIEQLSLQVAKLEKSGYVMMNNTVN